MEQKPLLKNQNKKILVVETERAMRKGIVLNLSNYFEVDEADSYNTAKEMLKKNVYNIIISACAHKQEEQGFGFVKTFKNLRPLIPVIVMTTYHSVELKKNLLNANADDLPVKGFLIEELLEKLEILFNEQ